eukprot:gnl/Chilomastix_cuspidata/340.p1 GENE.gnl/Chilomastix_cuspidata/340~~gnl/Chilomastix_cuspidata/340.p1  ORF type:complete len:605 (+),score=192.86 gnl/Chilomastix_cuspidata/340:96-1910(+)
MSFLLFETALEVANKIGGIHTVIGTKAPSVLKKIEKNNYVLLGIDTGVDETIFREEPLDSHPILRHVFPLFAKQYHIHLRFGSWLFHADDLPEAEQRYPYVILFSVEYTDAFASEESRARYFLSESYGLRFPNFAGSPQGFKVNAVKLGTCVALFLRTVCHFLSTTGAPQNVLLHSHEWCGAVGQLLLKRDMSAIPPGVTLKTVFTTHATILGRFLAAGGTDLLQVQRDAPSREILFAMAHDRQIGLEFGCEWNAAHTADVFTTVSHVTGDEACALLQRKPDIITFNGSRALGAVNLEVRRKGRSAFMEFVQKHFFGPSLETIDPMQLKIFITCGRNEFQNKGYDMFIDALARLNTRLKALSVKQGRRVDLTVLGLAIVPQEFPAGRARPELLGHFAYVQDKITAGVDPRTLARTEYPPVVSSRLNAPEKEQIARKAVAANLINHPGDPVKFTWLPQYVPLPGCLDLSISEVFQATDLGVFPSKYEPWGYTPIECLEKGVPAVTTNLAGSGEYFDSVGLVPDGWRASPTGLMVLDRKTSSYDEGATRLCDAMYDLLTLDHDEVDAMRARCLQTARACHWDEFVQHYWHAYRLALGQEEFFPAER